MWHGFRNCISVDVGSTWTAALHGQQHYMDSSSTWTAALHGHTISLLRHNTWNAAWAVEAMLGGWGVGWGYGIHSNEEVEMVVREYSRTPLIRIANYPDRLGPSGKCIENSTKLTYLEITCYQIKYSTVLWLIELQIRRGRKV